MLNAKLNDGKLGSLGHWIPNSSKNGYGPPIALDLTVSSRKWKKQTLFDPGISVWKIGECNWVNSYDIRLINTHLARVLGINCGCFPSIACSSRFVNMSWRILLLWLDLWIHCCSSPMIKFEEGVLISIGRLFILGAHEKMIYFQLNTKISILMARFEKFLGVSI